MILDDILARTRADLEVRKKARPMAAVDAAAAERWGQLRSLKTALRSPGRITCIAEYKRRSPSAGWINESADLETTVRAYAAGGASALMTPTGAIPKTHASTKLSISPPARACRGVRVNRRANLPSKVSAIAAAASRAPAACGRAACAEATARAPMTSER